jgi:hypothetical protein
LEEEEFPGVVVEAPIPAPAQSVERPVVEPPPPILPPPTVAPRASDSVPPPLVPLANHFPTEPQPPAGPSSGRVGSQNPGSSQGTGQGGTTRFFQVDVQAQKLVYVIDCSSSMGLHGALAAACREVDASLARLPPTAAFQIIVYNRTPRILCPAGFAGLLPATEPNRRLALQRLEQELPEGGTAHLPALRLALSLQPEVIFFLTDADDLNEEDLRTATRLNRGRCVIHAVELNRANIHRTDLPLHRLARDNGGRYQAVDLEAYRSP